MYKDFTKNFPAERWLYLFIFIHLLLWALVPALTRYNLPLDSIEGTIWGNQLEWGYDKNPFLNGWLTALATYLSNHADWTVYLFSQLSVTACFWAVWKLARNMLTPVYALVSVLVLEGIQYYNFHAIDFNDNTLELGLWALTSYCFYKALRARGMAPWILTGIFAALGMMAKYYTAALLASMVLFLLIDADNRKQLSTLPPYLGLAAFLLIILPHVVWLFFHQFITIAYVFKRATSPPVWTSHFFFPAQFTWQQLQAFLPALALFLLLMILPRGRTQALASTNEKTAIGDFNKAFLFYVGLGPFLLTILLSLLSGSRLRAGWGMPLLSLWGIMLIAAIQPRLTITKIRCFIGGIFLLMIVSLIFYSISLIDSPDPSSANFPGREFAQDVTQQWHDTYHTKLEYVAGSRWIGGNIGFYSADHPSVFIEWDNRRAPWIDLKKLRQHGAVFVWEITNNETMPDEIRKQFPRLLNTTIVEYQYQRNHYHLPPIKIGMAILPPANG